MPFENMLAQPLLLANRHKDRHSPKGKDGFPSIRCRAEAGQRMPDVSTVETTQPEENVATPARSRLSRSSLAESARAAQIGYSGKPCVAIRGTTGLTDSVRPSRAEPPRSFCRDFLLVWPVVERPRRQLHRTRHRTGPLWWPSPARFGRHLRL